MNTNRISRNKVYYVVSFGSFATHKIRRACCLHGDLHGSKSEMCGFGLLVGHSRKVSELFL